MDRINEKGTSGLLTWLLIAAALAALSAYASILALAIPLALTYMIVRFGAAGGVLGVAALGAAAVFSPGAAVAFAAGFVPVSIIAAMAIRRRWRFRDSVISASIAALVGVVLCVALLWLIKGVSPVEYAGERMNSLFALLSDDQINGLYQFMRSPDIVTGAITQQAVITTVRAAAIDNMLKTLSIALNYSLVPMMLNYSLLWGLLCYLIPRHYMARRGMPVKSVPVFSDYALPKYFWAAFLVSYLAALVLDSMKLSSFGILAPTIQSVYAFVFTVQALSFTDFLLKERGMRKGVRIVVYIAAVLIFGTYLMWVGIFENIVQFRKRTQEKGGAEL